MNCDVDLCPPCSLAQYFNVDQRPFLFVLFVEIGTSAHTMFILFVQYHYQLWSVVVGCATDDYSPRSSCRQHSPSGTWLCRSHGQKCRLRGRSVHIPNHATLPSCHPSILPPCHNATMPLSWPKTKFLREGSSSFLCLSTLTCPRVAIGKREWEFDGITVFHATLFKL